MHLLDLGTNTGVRYFEMESEGNTGMLSVWLTNLSFYDNTLINAALMVVIAFSERTVQYNQNT